MGELVFCCPQCLHIGNLGITADFQSLERNQHRPIFIHCRRCRTLNCVTVDDVLITTSVDDQGNFRPLRSDDPGLAVEPW